MVATDAAIRYRIDVGMSRFTVRAFATGLFSSLGHSPTLAIRDYTGEATFVPSESRAIGDSNLGEIRVSHRHRRREPEGSRRH